MLEEENTGLIKRLRNKKERWKKCYIDPRSRRHSEIKTELNVYILNMEYYISQCLTDAVRDWTRRALL